MSPEHGWSDKFHRSLVIASFFYAVFTHEEAYHEGLFTGAPETSPTARNYIVPIGLKERGGEALIGLHFTESRKHLGIALTDKFQHSTGLPDRKSVTNRLIAVRETGVSRHQGGPIEGPPETPRASQYYRIEGIKGVPDLGTKRNGILLFSV